MLCWPRRGVLELRSKGHVVKNLSSQIGTGHFRGDGEGMSVFGTFAPRYQYVQMFSLDFALEPATP